MSVRFPILLITLLLLATASYAQDFEADSIYYTPIPKNAAASATASPLKLSPRLLFRDTIVNEKVFRYYFNVQVGTLVGCNECNINKEVSFTTSTTHGVTIGKKLRTGLGLGFDSYLGWQSLPLFASTSWDILGTRNANALFVQFDFGWSKVWKTDGFDLGNGGQTGDLGGKMVYVGAGYRVKYYDVRMTFSIGAKFQQASYYFEFPTYYYTSDGIMVEGTPNRTTIEQSMSRLALTMAIGWK